MVFSLLAWPTLLLIPSISGQEANLLNGKHLRMAAENWDPLFVIAKDEEGGSPPTYSGVMSKVLAHLQASLNFSTTVARPPDGSWGVVDEETGLWGGMVGMVLRNEADFGLGEEVERLIPDLSAEAQEFRLSGQFWKCPLPQDPS